MLPPPGPQPNSYGFGYGYGLRLALIPSLRSATKEAPVDRRSRLLTLDLVFLVPLLYGRQHGFAARPQRAFRVVCGRFLAMRPKPARSSPCSTRPAWLLSSARDTAFAASGSLMPAISVGAGVSPGGGSRSSDGGTTRGARSASLGSTPTLLRVVEADGIEYAAVELHVIHGAAGHAQRKARCKRKPACFSQDVILGGICVPPWRSCPALQSRQRRSANPLRYNDFAASLQLAISESYSRPMTPATMATSAMLKTYQ